MVSKIIMSVMLFFLIILFLVTLQRIKLREFDIADLEEEPNAKVHTCVVGTSPEQRKGKTRFFTGELSDGRKNVKFVSFNVDLKPAFDKSKDEEKTVLIKDCRVSNELYG